MVNRHVSTVRPVTQSEFFCWPVDAGQVVLLWNDGRWGVDSIKNMKLYSSLDRVDRGLAALGYGPEASLPIDTLVKLDQLHYHGTDAVDLAIEAARINQDSRVLDIGSGYGGPARWIAHRTGACVDAVELQPDLNAFAANLTRRVGLNDHVSHVEGDILSAPLEAEHYNAAVSFLALYHIPAREPLFPRVSASLKPGGYLYVEDLYLVGEPSEVEQADLDGMMQANTLPYRDTYIQELTQAGFEDVAFHDMTEDWAAFTAERLASFRAQRGTYEDVHGVEVYEALDHFYRVIAGLLAGGNLGGVRLTARKP